MFKPDLVLCFNAFCPDKILNQLTCPICIFEADMPYLYNNLNGYNNLKKLLKQKNVYYIGSDSSSKIILQKYLGYQLESNKFLLLYTATGLTKKTIAEYKRNIFFCGSNWYGDFAFILENPQIYECCKTIYNKYKNIFIENSCSIKYDSFIYQYMTHIAGQKRLRYLQQLADLGLEIYGKDWKCMALSYDIELTELCHDKIISYNTISEYYNSSKISVNFSHPQAINSFSFRVMDIMASNSCILTEDKKDFHLLFDKYISSEVQDLILYKNRFDMREKAIKLLENENLRQKCVSECNYAIEQNGRWIHRLKELETFLGKKLVNANEKKGSCVEYLYTKATNEKNILLEHEKSKINLKNISNGLFLFLNGLPLINKIFTYKLKSKLIKSILKYNEPEYYFEYMNYDLQK